MPLLRSRWDRHSRGPAAMEAKASRSRTERFRPPGRRPDRGDRVMLADQAERDLIASEADRLLFVEAGAGTGKTTVLVERIVSMVTGAGGFEPVPMPAIAAITFTEKAAAELRNRVRAELSKALQTAPDRECELVQAALGELDGAAVSTLHGFARRILAEHPIEAGLPPSFDTLDEIASDVAFDERWEAFLSELLSDEPMRWPIGMLDAVGVSTAHLRDLARALNDNADRLEWPAHAAAMLPLETAEIESAAADLLQLRRECANPAECKLYASFPPVSTLVERLANARNSRERLRALLSAGIPRVGNKGRQGDWPDISEVRGAFDELRSLVAGSVSAVVTEALAQVCERLRSFTVDGAMHRRLAGGLEFHDLLTRARWLLRDSPAALQVRTALSQQYQRLLIDEFQDTDPIQIELARLIAFPDGLGAPSAEPERLFFVGDPKQSIYRFRRADIALYMDAQQRLGQELGSVVSLTTNFRTLPEVVAWINDVFSQLITEVPGIQPPYRALIAGRQLPSGAQTHPHGGSRVTVLGLPAHPAEAHIEDVREAESEDVAGAITTIMKERWTVIDPDTGTERCARPSDIAVLIPKRTGLEQLEDALSEAGISYRLEAASFVWRTQMVRDLMMCLRAVADPTDALAVASVLRTPVYGCGDDDLYLHRVSHHGSWNYTDPRLVEGADTPVTEALAHLRSLHLRHTVLGPAELIDSLVSERRLYEQVAARPRPRDAWRQIRYVVDQARAWSDSQHGGLRGFLAWATGQASENSRITESILPESDDDAVRVMTIHAAKGLEFPIVIVAGLQDKPRKRTGVQVIFGSDDAQPEIRVRGDVESHDFWERNEAEIVALHYERLRLLYVACTRARDRLIVSVHRKPRPRTTGGEHNLESGELLANAVNRLAAADSSRPLSGETWQAHDFRAIGAQLDTPAADDSHDGTLAAGDRRATTAPDGTAGAASGDLFGSREEWLQRHAAAVQASRKPAYLSASALAKQHAVGTIGARDDDSDESGLASELDAAGLSKDDESADIGLAAGSQARAHGDAANGAPPMRHGRYGTALGSAVHAVLQSIDIADPTTHGREALRALAYVCARDHGASGREREVLRRVESALASRTVAEAALGRFWQEVFVTAPLDDGGVLEGFIDLLYETPEGRLVVVDFKTDAIADSDTVEQKTAYYRLQGATYAWCAQQATGMEVERIVFQFLTRDAVAEGVIEGADLAQALKEVPAAAQRARGGGR
ncbi:MAG: AAA family ATPase [Acidimicrobiales bacterium]|nr:AAA family ATPase [Acidimicrobiales bacterium]MYH73715.1 AAA family ATPase [Acidimicrobiales bacterium]MYK70797.1 AAA family ATPase [Acidimicrobiales bacterium]